MKLVLFFIVCASVSEGLKFSPFGLYEDIVVEISESVPRQKCQRALDNLEALMTSVSSQLYDATGGRGRFGSFRIIVPSAWNNEMCLKSRNILNTYPHSEEASFKVESPHPIFGAQPWARQFGQCGVPGLDIHLPYPILVDDIRTSQETRVRTFQEWIRYRYGVFPEIGFPDDPMYPDFYNLGPQRRKNEGCNTTLEVNNNGTRSIGQMALCTSSSDYDRHTPTKQNLLCNGQSALETILQSKDFLPINNGNKSQTLGIQLPPPRFSYAIKKTTLSIILVLDLSQKMQPDDRWVRTRDALFRFVSHLPTGSELGIITAGSNTAQVNIEPTVVRESNREGLHGRIPYRLLNDREACLDCGVAKALELLDPNHLGSIIIVSSEPYQYEGQDPNIYQVFFDEPQNNNSSRKLEISSTKGLFKVPRTSRILQSLTSIFLSILKQAHGPHIECTHQRFYHFESNLHHFFEDNYQVIKGNSIEGTFTVEKELSTDLWVILTPSPGFEEDIQVFEITSPSGRKYVFPKYDHGIVYFHFEAQNNEAGVWSFQAQMHPIVTKTMGSMISLEVFGQQSNGNGAVTMDFWTAPSSDGLSTILYASVSQDHLPIEDANVEAFVYSPLETLRPYKLKLEDLGTGYPDITAGDGIYSAYLTVSQTSGYFSLLLKTDYNKGGAYLPKPYGNEKSFNCCGSKLPDFYTIPTSPFERVFSGHSFTSFKTFEKKDPFPPSRITDFRVEKYENRSLNVKLQWTAPGDDYNKGTAFRYEIKCYTNPGALKDFVHKAIPVHESQLPNPQVAGSKQSITVSVPWANEVFYYAIVTLDESNNRAQVSNLVPVYVEELKTTTQLEMSFKVVNSTVEKSKFEAVLDNDTMIYVISGGITAFLLVLIALFTVAMCRAKRTKARMQAPPPIINEATPTEPNIYVVNSNDNGQLSSVTTVTSVLPDVTVANDNKFDLWKMDSLMDQGYINTYFRGNSTSNYPSLQAFPNPSNPGPMSLLSLNISHNPKPMTTSQTNLNLTSSQLPLQVFRNGSGSSAGTSASRDESPTYQNWSTQTTQIKEIEKKDRGSDCTSSTECSEDSDRQSDNVCSDKKVFNDSKNAPVPTPAPRTTLEKQSKSSGSIRSVSVERVKQVRHESLV